MYIIWIINVSQWMQFMRVFLFEFYNLFSLNFLSCCKSGLILRVTNILSNFFFLPIRLLKFYEQFEQETVIKLGVLEKFLCRMATLLEFTMFGVTKWKYMAPDCCRRTGLSRFIDLIVHSQCHHGV